MATWLIICVVLAVAVLAVILGKIAWAIRTAPTGERRYRRAYRAPVRRVTTVTDPREQVEDHS